MKVLSGNYNRFVFRRRASHKLARRCPLVRVGRAVEHSHRDRQLIDIANKCDLISPQIDVMAV